MAEKKPSAKAEAWPIFDAVVANAAIDASNPWSDGVFHPDYGTLRTLLAIPLYLGADSRTGVPALALDVWTAYELRRAGLDPDAVWPRAEPPRTVSRDVLAFINGVSPAALRKELMTKLVNGAGSVGRASANILGKNYLKQVDVIVSGWQTGPELLISTKRMDSSFGKNAANRVEESYGDAKNLALRHPLAALGFLYALRSTAYDDERRQFDWIVDLLIKLGREEDAYDACCLLVPEWDDEGRSADQGEEDDTAPIEPDDTDVEDVDEEIAVDDIRAALAALPVVTLRHDLVPDDLSPQRFFTVLLNELLDSTPLTLHEHAKQLRADGRSSA